MDKQASPGMDNSVTRLPIPVIGDINNRRFVTAVLAGILGGAGVSSAANLLRSFREMRKPRKDETDDETIVLTLPSKAAEDGYTSMLNAKPGESKVTTDGSRQFRESGKYGKSTGMSAPDKNGVKCAEGNPGPNTVGTVVANTLGLAAGGLMSYEVVSRIFDALNERRLKRKLEAAQQAYIGALSGNSKRAEALVSVLAPVEHVILKEPLEKEAAGIFDWLSDSLPDSATNAVRYPAAAYILALLAGTGATSYVTKKVMDREFPEEKIKKDINRPTRVVFRVDKSRPSLVEGEKGKEKKAEASTCAALTAALPIYMDVVEGKPNRTLSDPYVKLAAAAGTDPEGLMKMAKVDMGQVFSVLLSDPMSLWEILKGTRFGLDFNVRNAAGVLKRTRPDTYRRAVDAAIDSHFAGSPNDGIVAKAYNGIGKWYAKNIRNPDDIVDSYLKEAAFNVMDSDYLREAILDKGKEDESASAPIDEKDVVARVRKALKGKRRVSVVGSDPAAKAYIRKNGPAIRKILERLNAQGSI